MSDLLARISRGKTAFLSSPTIIKCEDSFWQDIVELCLQHASVVIIDMTELTEHLIWELRTARRIMRPESIILACAVDADGNKALPATVQNELESLFGHETMGKFQVFFYPARTDQLRNWPGSRKFSRDLSQCIAGGLVHTRPLGESVLQCPNCESPYRLSDYRSDVEKIFCSVCKAELPRQQANLQQA